jgi:DDE superfamily endonuclease
MPDILTLLDCLAPYLSAPTIKQLSQISAAIIMMSGRITMLGMSRWTDKGGSYRSIQRFFYTHMPWSQLFWAFFRQYLFNPEAVYLLVGDESVVAKAGKETHGLDRFFSSLYGKAIPSLSFFALSLVDTQARQSYPLMVEQRVRSAAEKAASKAKSAQKKVPGCKVGRPKGSKNKDKGQIELPAELIFIQAMIQQLLSLIQGVLPLSYLVLDGHFGHHNALHMTRQCGLHLISKLRQDAALYFPYTGAYSGRGRRRKYGDKVDYAHLPQQYLKQVSVEDDIQTRIYQTTLLHKHFAQALNVVIIVKMNLKTGKHSHVILFSSDLNLVYDRLIDYYGLRFQIEFNFRDAKQYWGLEDFMNVTETAVRNAANLSLFMVNVAARLLCDFRQHSPSAGVLDLKTHFRGCKYVTETLKLLPKMPEPILFQHIFQTVARLGSIHDVQPHINTS